MAQVRKRSKSRVSSRSAKVRAASASRSSEDDASPSNATRLEKDNHWTWIESKPVPSVTLPFLYESHVNLMLVIIAAVIMVLPFYLESEASLSKALVKSFPYCCAMLLTVGMVAFPHGPFIRPHPLVWRVLFGLSIIYLLFLTALLFLSADQARSLLNLFDSRVGIPFELPSYVEDCSLTVSNLWSKMDIFVPAHFFGWLVKALMIRHRVLLWTFSICWELLEVSLIYAVPNFAECWWDVLILDILVCNGLGLEFGLYLCNYLEHKRYAWTGVLEHKTLVAKIKRAALQFTPESWTTVKWESTNTVTRFFQVQGLLFLGLVLELNGFMLKLNLYVPTEHPWFSLRSILVVLIGMPSMRQYYLYCVDSRVNRLGSQAIVAILICFAEVSLTLKTVSPVLFNPPPINKYMWAGFALVYGLVCAFLLLRYRKDKKY